MTDDELIDKILTDLHNLNAPSVNTDFITAADTTGGTDEKRRDRIRRRLYDEDLCSFSGHGMSLSPQGHQIVEQGGYMTYLSVVAKQNAYEEEKERIQFENLKIELAKNKWDYQLRWITLIIAIAAFIIGVVALLI